MDNKRIYVKKLGGGRVIVVDPNKMMDKDENPSPRYVPQEDLVMYAKLTAHSNGETHILQNAKGAIETTTNGDVFINFLNPVDDTAKKTNTVNALTTRWTDLFDTKEAYRSETFGIESINIEYNASYVPTVTINFVDLRGKTLFERGDDPSNPYNIFFQFPYPQFTLTVKGYYGRTTSLPLILEKTNTNFDGQTGDYKTVATFRSFTFALLNDIPLRYIVQAPYMYEAIIKENGKNTTTYEGITILVKILEQYSREIGVDLCEFQNDKKNIVSRQAIQSFDNVSDYLSKILSLKDKSKTVAASYKTINIAAANYHKKYPITIPDFIYRLSKLEAEITSSKMISQRLSEYNEIIKTYDALSNLEKEFLNGLRNFESEYTFERNGGDFYFPGEYKDDNKLTELLRFVSSYLKINIVDNVSTYNIGSFNYYKELVDATSIAKLNEKLYIDKENDPEFLIINANQYIKEINKNLLEKLSKIQFKASSRLEEKILEAAKVRIGFAPTFKNALVLILANFETFLTLLYQKSLLARKQIDDDNIANKQTGSIRKRGPYEESNVVEQYDKFSKDNFTIYPWPDFFKKDGTSSGYNDRAYPGELAFFRDREEIKFIDELIESVIRLQEDIGNRGSGTEVEDSRPQVDYTPITSEDIPVLFNSGDGLTLNSDGNKLYNPEERGQNIGNYKFGRIPNIYDTYKESPISVANILVKAMECSIFNGISSSNPSGTNSDTIKFDDIASQLGEAHGNNLYNSYGAKSQELLAIHNLITKTTTDLSMSFFDEFFVNQRKYDDIEQGETIDLIKKLIKDGYRTIWGNSTTLTEKNGSKEAPYDTDINSFKEEMKPFWGRAGYGLSFEPTYNSNIHPFGKINGFNENYVRPSGSEGPNKNEHSVDDKAIANLLNTGDQINGNYDYLIMQRLIKTAGLATKGTTYNNPNNSSLFDEDNTSVVKKLSFGLQDVDGDGNGKDTNNRQKYLNRFHLYEIETTPNSSIGSLTDNLYREYPVGSTTDYEEEIGMSDDESIDDFLMFDSTDTDIRVTPSDISNSYNNSNSSSSSLNNASAFIGGANEELCNRIFAFMDTISFFEGTSDVLQKTTPKYYKNNGYDVCLDGMKPSLSNGVITAITDGGSSKNVLVGWTPDGNMLHPNNTFGGISTAVGRYQFIGKYWNGEYGFSKQALGGENLPITKYNQEVVGIWLVLRSPTKDSDGKDRGAKEKTNLLINNNMRELFRSVAGTWRSLPSPIYSQSKNNTYEKVMDRYNRILEYNKSTHRGYDINMVNHINSAVFKSKDYTSTVNSDSKATETTNN